MILAVTMVMMALSTSMFAQGARYVKDGEVMGGLFNSVPTHENTEVGFLHKNTRTLQDYTPGLGGVGNQPFGIEPTAPLGSGVLMLIAAGAGYAMMKRKKNNK